MWTELFSKSNSIILNMCDKWKDRSSCAREIHICELNRKGNEIRVRITNNDNKRGNERNQMKETEIIELNPYKNDSAIIRINNTWRDRRSWVKEN